MAAVVAIIPARGGSRGIPRKNLVDFCGKPLVAWSIEQATRAQGIDQVWVTSDSEEILQVAARYGARTVRRPPELAGDDAPSDAAWLHALEVIEGQGVAVDVVVGLQPTSPIREPADLEEALRLFHEEGLDSLLTCVPIRDFFIWRIGSDGRPVAVTYDYRHRLPRQALETHYLENGSFYIFRSAVLRTTGNRLGGRIGLYVMQKHKMFQIDASDDLVLCQAIMRSYGLAF